MLISRYLLNCHVEKISTICEAKMSYVTLQIVDNNVRTKVTLLLFCFVSQSD